MRCGHPRRRLVSLSTERKEEVVHARVSTFRGSPESIEKALAQAEEATSVVRGFEGNEGLIVLVDREGGRELTITLWDSADSLRASEEAANRIRRDLASSAGEEIQGVDRYEVAHFEVPGRP
jgi:heme-degrading monooxygenase HmoA